MCLVLRPLRRTARRAATGSTRLGMLWSAESGLIDTTGGGDNFGVFEKTHALFSGEAARLIFVWDLNRNVSTIALAARCRMRQTSNKASHDQKDRISMETAIKKETLV